MARALQAHPFPSAERLPTQPQRAVPQVPQSWPGPNASATVDIEAMARQGASLMAPPTAQRADALRIFITLDMPRASLQRLLEQATRAGATLVLRGLKAGSMRQTMTAVSALIETRLVAWVIDPDAFTRFRVSSAPTFVLTLAGGSSSGSPASGLAFEQARCAEPTCAAPVAFVTVSGDVSLDYALQTMLRQSPAAAPFATAILQRLNKS